MEQHSNIAAKNGAPSAQPLDNRAVLPALPSELDEQPLIVADDLPGSTPICEAELDAIERYMGDILDEVLGRTGREN